MNFKHSKKSKSLKGFEKKFYGAIVELSTVLCNATGAKPGEVKITYSGDENKSLSVIAIVDVSLLEIRGENIENYAKVLIKHFPAFFTPAHYRPYVDVCTMLSIGDKLEIIGKYEHGV